MVCVVTKSVEQDVCHYWPFAANDTATYRDGLRGALLRSMLEFSEGMRVQLTTLFVPWNWELGASDKEWNMISLNTKLRRYWARRILD